MMKVTYHLPGSLGTAETDEIFRFRYRVFVEEQGINDTFADHKAKSLSDPLDETAYHITARHNGALIGTGRANIVADGIYPMARTLFQIEDFEAPEEQVTVGLSTRLMIAKTERAGFATLKIMTEGLKVMLLREAEWCLAVCRPELEDFFTRMGYVIHARDLVHPVFGNRSLMKYNVNDPPRTHSVIAAKGYKAAREEAAKQKLADPKSTVSPASK